MKLISIILIPAILFIILFLTINKNSDVKKLSLDYKNQKVEIEYFKKSYYQNQDEINSLNPRLFITNVPLIKVIDWIKIDDVINYEIYKSSKNREFKKVKTTLENRIYIIGDCSPTNINELSFDKGEIIFQNVEEQYYYFIKGVNKEGKIVSTSFELPVSISGYCER